MVIISLLPRSPFMLLSSRVNGVAAPLRVHVVGMLVVIAISAFCGLLFPPSKRSGAMRCVVFFAKICIKCFGDDITTRVNTFRRLLEVAGGCEETVRLSASFCARKGRTPAEANRFQSTVRRSLTRPRREKFVFGIRLPEQTSRFSCR